MRDRLIELIQASVNGCARNWAEVISDHLLANGVIVPPCKVGDKLWVIRNGCVTNAKVLAFYIDGFGGMFDLQITEKEETVIGFKNVIDKDNYQFSDFGKTVFLTREEAEAKLKEGE